MLTKKQFRMLELLNEMVMDCQDCVLWKNDNCCPYISKTAKYLIVGEAPDLDEIKSNEPFVGKAGEILWKTFKQFNLEKSDFIIVNSVNCRPVWNNTNKNGKPSFRQIIECGQWLIKYIKILKPKNIIALGNFAKWNFSRSMIITMNNGKSEYFPDYDTTVTYCVHPAYTIYNGHVGMKMLFEGINAFKKEIRNE